MNPVDDPGSAVGIVEALAPIRICDSGGWTDTWFAGHGKVFNLGVLPGVEVRIHVHPIGTSSHRVVLDAEDFGDRYGFEPGSAPGRHRLLEATVEEIGLPDGCSVDIRISSPVPPGCSTGTSAAVTVALVGALDALRPTHRTRRQIAATAHRIEVGRLGMESGVQDQLCAVYGGINFIEITDYPVASVSRLALPDSVRRELERRLVLVFLGRTHVSSDVHASVIAGLRQEGPDSPRLEALRRAAEATRDAVIAADFPAFGRAMIENTEAQRQLHDELIGPEAQLAIDLAVGAGALGWKINGAGGAGGSLTILCGPGRVDKVRLLSALDRAEGFRVIPTRLSRHGLQVWHR